MKKIFFSLLLIPTIAFSQKDSSEFKFTLIDSIKETKNELFIKAKVWLANTFVSSKAVIEMEDKEAGKIIGKGVMVYDKKDTYYTTHMSVRYTLTVTVKDNKYRLVLSDFINDGYLDNPSERINGSGLKLDDVNFLALGYSKDVIPEVTRRANDIVETFRIAMKKETKKDDF